MKDNIFITKDINKANCITHAGTFHADEIFSTIILSYVLEKIVLIRVNEIDWKDVENQLVYDIGGKELDHHQHGGNGQRENGVKYASCGLVWKKYGRKLLELQNVSKEKIDVIWENIDKNLIQFIDSNDNGQTPTIDLDYKFVSLATIISSFNPRWNEQIDSDDKFMHAIAIAKIIFNNTLQREIAKADARIIVEKAFKKVRKSVLILDVFVPWKEILLEIDKEEKVLFAITPSNRGGYNLYTVPKTLGSFENRVDLPKAWAGLRNEKLQEVCGIKTARFCHENLFIASADTLEDIRKMSEIAVKNIKK